MAVYFSITAFLVVIILVLAACGVVFVNVVVIIWGFALAASPFSFLLSKVKWHSRLPPSSRMPEEELMFPSHWFDETLLQADSEEEVLLPTHWFDETLLQESTS
ncbi:hypothetical protein Zm00014a_016687 [Zea mays]|jgi:hypothetical protein|uniref:Uncharacterized protein n=2 Tax=Zea mays TaxID=4577 RepID=B6TT17_MAIZE|nr:uncharacterized protein LOC100277333 [Zea mays]ACG40250.1 hypothetical protein [Zea mays]AQK44456.1 hypothetical protein ZEAMMB73_Zm00001d025744 [Zea mays]PWZ45161.1 hypothetical protein Zm00014a_016687 [Zea mays]|eukprot:NP_001144400.1 uncharacterized protein LOC100277333 [Zea mays]